MFREVKQIIRRLESEFECTVTLNKSGHYRVTRPGYPSMVTIGSSPSTRGSVRSIKGDLKRELGISL